MTLFLLLLQIAALGLEGFGAYDGFTTPIQGQFTWGRIRKRSTTDRPTTKVGRAKFRMLDVTEDSAATIKEAYTDVVTQFTWGRITRPATTESTKPRVFTREKSKPTKSIPRRVLREPTFTVNELANSNMKLIDPLDALKDSEEFSRQPLGKGVDPEDYVQMTTLPPTTEMSVAKKISMTRKPLTEKQLLKFPFVFGCCDNSTYVGCAGVCPETCQYRSKYCMPLCGPPCRCKRGYVYNIDAKACTLRTDCPKGIVQSRNGVYRVFV